MKRFVSLVLLIAVLIGAVFGGANFLSMQETIRGMRSAMNGASGTAIFEKSDLYIFMFPSGRGYAMSVITKYGDPVSNLEELGTAVKQGAAEAAERINYLTGNGWKQISKNDLPPHVIGMLSSFATYLFTIGVGTLTTLPLVPLVDYKPITAPEGIKQ